jgi:ubiquinol-cytochrome c reductase cytochrome b subunit
LPFDQRGYWAARVPLNILGVIPVLGPPLQQLLLGGAEVGHLTLTRFFALHAGLLPLAFGAVLGGRLWLEGRYRRLEPPTSAGAGGPYWPDQCLKNAVVWLALLALPVGLVIGRHGVDLGAPADPSATYSAARPEWFFLFLFQFLKGFPGGTEVWGAVVIPTVVFGLFALMPCLGRSRGGHGFNVALVSLLALGAAALTHRAWREDQADPIYRAAVTQAARDAARARALAMAPAGIPREGALVLLRQDPLTQGPRLFRQHCASCHRYDGHDGTGLAPREEPTAADLAGFGSRPWLAGLLDPARVASLHYFGGTRFKNGQMVRFVQQHVAALPPEGQRQIDQVIRALSGEAQLPGQRQRDQQEADLLAEGRQWLAHEAMRCTECHRFHDQGEDPSGPDLTGYGSRPWLVDFIAQPAHERFYGRRNDRMPQFGRDQILEPAAIGLIADWLRGDWYEPAP